MATAATTAAIRADAVADEGEPALDEEDPDQGCGDADEHGGHEGEPHEVQGEQVTHSVTCSWAWASASLWQ
jgi:hypothetical protein